MTATQGPAPDAAEVVDRLHHRMQVGADGTLGVEDDRYRAVFGPEGFELDLRGTGAFALATAAVTRGSHAVELVPRTWNSDGNVARRTLAGGVTEQVTATDGQIEWDVVLDGPPTGAGDLRIEAEVTGAAGPPTQSGAEWRWPLADGAIATMDEVVVKDASGAEIHRSLPDATTRRVALEVPADVLDTATYPLTVDPTISPAYDVAPTSPGDEIHAAIAFDGTNYLVVWRDDRDGDGDIYGARVRPDGTALSGTGFPISTAAPDQAFPAVSYGNGRFLVAWRHLGANDYDVRGARVTTAGDVLDSTAIPISTATGGQVAPNVDYDGTNWFVVWQDTRAAVFNFDVYGARVSFEGSVLDPSGIAIGTAGTLAFTPDVAFDGTNHLVVWSEFRSEDYDIFGARVNKDGVVLDPTVPVTGGGIAISTATDTQEDPAVAYNGTRFLVVWQDLRHQGSADPRNIYGARVRLGVVEDGAGILISPRSQGNESAPDVAANGPFLVVWEFPLLGGVGVAGRRFSNAGTAVDPQRIPVTGSDGIFAQRPAVAASTSGNIRFGIAYDSAADEFNGQQMLLKTFSK